MHVILLLSESFYRLKNNLELRKTKMIKLERNRNESTVIFSCKNKLWEISSRNFDL